MEAALAIQQVSQRRRVERHVTLALAEQPVVGVERKLRAVVEDTSLRDEQMQRRKLLLHELYEAPAGAQGGGGVERCERLPELEAEHLGVARGGGGDGHTA